MQSKKMRESRAKYQLSIRATACMYRLGNIRREEASIALCVIFFFEDKGLKLELSIGRGNEVKALIHSGDECNVDLVSKY